MSKVIDLYEFLLEAELHQYYSELKNDLKASLIIVLYDHKDNNVCNLIDVHINCMCFVSGYDCTSS